MKKSIKRTLFIIFSILSFAIVQANGATYKPGLYKASAMGKKSKKHSGVVEVEVKVSESKIEKINVLTYEQSMDHKKYGPLAEKAKSQIPGSIINKQSINVDAVAKATVSSDAIKLAVAKALMKATVKYKPGIYKGFATGKTGKGDFGAIEVEVKLSESKIEDILIKTYKQSIDHKKYGGPVTKAKEAIPAAILKTQSLEVDAISKATISSIAIQLAVANALEKARK